MKKFACLGLSAVLMFSIVGCSKKQEEVAAPVETAVSEEAPVETASTIEEVTVTEEDLLPFFKAFFSFTEEDLMVLNKNEQIDNQDYFNNIKIYRDKLKETLGKYLSETTLKNLGDANAKLDFDLPKKVQVNEYVADAIGELKGIKILSRRALGDETIYEVEATTINAVTPLAVFNVQYEWKEEEGYYVFEDEGDAKLHAYFKELRAQSDNNPTDHSYVYADGEKAEDAIQIKSRYQVLISNKDAKVNQIKRAATIADDFKNRQYIETTSYVDRMPYYEEASESEQKLLNQLFGVLMTTPRETYLYYDKIYGESFNLVKSMWNDLGFVEKIDVQEVDYKDAFSININPYKDQIVKLNFDKSKMKVVPSIYSSKLQPAFVVTVPVEALLNDNTTKYYQYKYFVGMEENKIESIKFMKMLEITAEEYENNMTKAEMAQSEEEASSEPATQSEQVTEENTNS